MSTPEPNPLNAAHLEQINQALATAEAGLKAIDLAKRAGINVDQQEKSLQESISKLKAIKQTYFPNAR